MASSSKEEKPISIKANASSSSKEEKPVSIKLFVDKTKRKVVFMESSKDFVDILLSFLTLPMGTVVKLLDKHSSVGCMDKLYQSLENLDSSHMTSETHKTMLLHPGNHAAELLKKLKINLDDTQPITSYICNRFDSRHRNDERLKYTIDKSTECEDCGSLMDLKMHSFASLHKSFGIFSDQNTKFMIKDDLFISPLSTHDVFKLFENMGTNVDTLVECALSIGSQEILLLLQRSFLSMTPLTDVFFGFGDNIPSLIFKPKTNIPAESYDDKRVLKKRLIKVYLNTLDGKVLYVEANQDFIEQLFSYLTFPVGSVVRLLNEKSCMGCVENLYKSVAHLGSLNVFNNFEDSNRIFLNPRLPTFYSSKDQLLNVEEDEPPTSYFTCNIKRCYPSIFLTEEQHYCDVCMPGSFLRGRHCKLIRVDPSGKERGFMNSNATFMVTDQLEVTPLSITSSLILLRNAGVSAEEVEEIFVDMGKLEALALLKSCLTSKTALTAAFGNTT